MPGKISAKQKEILEYREEWLYPERPDQAKSNRDS